MMALPPHLTREMERAAREAAGHLVKQAVDNFGIPLTAAAVRGQIQGEAIGLSLYLGREAVAADLYRLADALIADGLDEAARARLDETIRNAAERGGKA